MTKCILCGVLAIILILNFNISPFYTLKERLNERFFRGRLSKKEWDKRVLKKCKKWIIKTPTISSTDVPKTTLISKIKRDQNKAIQVWQSGSIYLALKEYNEVDQDLCTQQLLTGFKTNAQHRYSAEDINAADYGLLCFSLMENGCEATTKQMCEYIEKNQTDKKMIFYKENAKEVLFIDTLGFVCPFLVKYGILTGQEQYISLAKTQIETYLKFGIDKQSQLPYHAYLDKTKTKRGIGDWGRGLAWLLIALMDSYKCIIADGREDEFFRQNIIKYAEKLLELQALGGGFSWQLLSGGMRKDSSITAVAGWYLACAGTIIGDRKYYDAAVKCREHLIGVTNNNGSVDFCQGDTIGIGVYSRAFSKMPFAQGFTLRMETEIAKNE